MKMKKISTIIIGLSLIASNALFAVDNHMGDHMHEGKMANHEKEAMQMMTSMDMSSKSANKSSMSKGAYKNTMMVNGYSVTLSSMKPLSDGKNPMSIILKKDGKIIKNANVKIKFFMTMMPGMEFTEQAKLSGDKYTSNIDFSMQGEWAYELDFKTRDGKIHTAKGSVNL